MVDRREMTLSGCQLVPLFSVVFALLLSPVSAAASEQPMASLTIRFAGARTQFYTGEIIPLELVFSAPPGSAYEISIRSYDRSGRLDLEQYNVSPPGRDPLYNYYHGSLFSAFLGGGLGGFRQLDDKPYTLRTELNEWVALDEPGHYRLFVNSKLVSRRDFSNTEALELRSNSLQFEVVEADRLWHKQSLSRAASLLNDPRGAKEEKQRAARILRFLDSPSSVREMVRQLVRPSEVGTWDFFSGPSCL